MLIESMWPCHGPESIRRRYCTCAQCKRRSQAEGPEVDVGVIGCIACDARSVMGIEGGAPSRNALVQSNRLLQRAGNRRIDIVEVTANRYARGFRRCTRWRRFSPARK